MKTSGKKWLVFIIIGFLMVACLALNPGSSYSLMGKLFYKTGGFCLFFPAFTGLLFDIGIIKGKEKIPLLRSHKKSPRIVFWIMTVLLGLGLFFSFSAFSKIEKNEPTPQVDITLQNSYPTEQQGSKQIEPEDVYSRADSDTETPSTDENTELEIIPSEDNVTNGDLLKENQTVFDFDPKEYELGDINFNIDKMLIEQNVFKNGSFLYTIDLYVSVKNKNESSVVNFIGQRTGGQAGVYYGKEECIIGTRNDWGIDSSDATDIPKDYIFKIAPCVEQTVCLTSSYISTDDIREMSELKMDLYFTSINTANPDSGTKEIEINFNLAK